jgi:hypothetical protein
MKKVNPLTSFMRQPKIYITLPSQGMYWAPGSIQVPETGELPVFSMTAKDELAFKTPDALLNGQAVVDVIQSCIPAIKDAWRTPNIDLDLILIAIRIATYGEKMEITHKVPNTEEEVEHEIDLRTLVDQLSISKWEEAVDISDDLTCFIRPLTYKHMTATGLKTFETQRLMQAVNDETLTDERKLEIFNQSFNKMTDITIDLMADTISSIQTPDAIVKDPVFIKEFLQNADKEVFQKLQNHLNKLKLVTGLQPLKMKSTPELIEAGAPETYELPIKIDNADFFGQGS